VSFNQRLERASAEQNFRIAPAVAGTISWANNFRTLQFMPSSPLAFDTEYTVTIDTGAHNYFGVGLDVNGDGVGGEVYTFTVHTVANDTVPPVLSATYPSDNETGISPTVQFEADLTEPMDPMTLSGAFILRDSLGNSVSLTAPVSQAVGTGIRLSFRPASGLAPSAAYTLSIQTSMRDYGGNSIAAEKSVPFATGPNQTFTGTVINTLDAVGGWWQPGSSGSTVGTQSTSFSIATDIRKSGAGSGKVSYVFSGASGGVVREYNSGKPTVDPGPWVAAWVFGDNSHNALEYWFYPGSGASYTGIRVDTLDWTGWKLVATSIESVPTTATRQFAGFVVLQLPGGRPGGSVYFDDLSVGTGVVSVPGDQLSVPGQTALFQNFPNPFNPKTVISYQVGTPGGVEPVRPGSGLDPEWNRRVEGSGVSDVRLAVYDILGREVAVLVNEKKGAGYYAVTFDASGLASGVYIYRMTAGEYRESKKLLLLR
jgi:hypothetical protein